MGSYTPNKIKKPDTRQSTKKNELAKTKAGTTVFLKLDIQIRYIASVSELYECCIVGSRCTSITYL